MSKLSDQIWAALAAEKRVNATLTAERDTYRRRALALVAQLRRKRVPRRIGAKVLNLSVKHNLALRAERDAALTKYEASQAALADVLAEHTATVAELERLQSHNRRRGDADLYLREEAEKLAARYGCKPGELQAKWRRQPAPAFDYQECMAAVLDALNREGIPAWDGDATGCVVQIVAAQAKQGNPEPAP